MIVSNDKLFLSILIYPVVRNSSVTRRVVSFDRGLYYTVSLFTKMCKWIPATYCWGGNLKSRTTILAQGYCSPIQHII